MFESLIPYRPTKRNKYVVSLPSAAIVIGDLFVRRTHMIHAHACSTIHAHALATCR